MHVDNLGFFEETQQEELLPLGGLGPTAHSPAQLMQEQSDPRSQALDSHVGLFHREDFETPAKWCLMRLHLQVCFTGLGCRSLLLHSLHVQSIMYEKGRICSLFLLWFIYVLLLSNAKCHLQMVHKIFIEAALIFS